MAKPQMARRGTAYVCGRGAFERMAEIEARSVLGGSAELSPVWGAVWRGDFAELEPNVATLRF
jgi:hypothetical protein